VDYRIVGPPLPEVVLLRPFRGEPGAFGEVHGRIVHIDRYGNAVTTIRGAQVFPTFELSIGDLVIDRHVRTFASAPPGVPFCHVDSSGSLAIAMNQESAAAKLGLSRGQPVKICCR
jgi:S-adenosylmethionine hydrolase